MRKTLLVTNDFPPRPGGIQSYLYRFVQELPPQNIGVYCSTWSPQRCEEFDAQQPFRLYRRPTSVLLPTPSVIKEIEDIILRDGYEAVWFGAAAPLGLMAARLRRNTGVDCIIASTHGHEVGWAMIPGARHTLRAIGSHVDTLTYVSHYTQRRIHRAFGPHPQMVWLPSGVDTQRFAPRPQSKELICQRHHLQDEAPLIVCISRLVPRKGQDRLLDALPTILRTHPTAQLLIVGGGPYAESLHRRAQKRGIEDHVCFTGLVPEEDLPLYYAASDIFAMPCRTRGKGLDVEGLGIVFLEASASAVPTVVGDSGGAPETVRDGTTGLVVSGHRTKDLVEALTQLLDNPEDARQMGDAGRQWMLDEWQWSTLGERLRSLLSDAAPTCHSG